MRIPFPLLLVERRVIIALFILSLVPPVHAQKNIAELISLQTDIHINDGKLLENVRYEIQINNREGDEYSEISILHSKLVRVSKIEAYITDNNGIIVRKLQKKDITDRSAISSSSLYEDDFVREFTLKHNSYPYRITVTYEETQEQFMYIDKWIPVLDPGVPTTSAVLNITVPINYKIAYKSRLTDSLRIDTISQTIKYTWFASYKNKIEKEVQAPGLITFLPEVSVVPSDFNYNIQGSLKTWVEFGDWQTRMFDGLSDLPESEKIALRYVTDTIKNEREKIKQLYYYLQDRTRYINVTIETGGIKPYPASYVSVNKYGDCKALTNYFKSILECFGIKSFYTLAYAGDKINPIDRSFPSQQFNHAILCVPQKSDTLWLDCTSKEAFGYLGTFTQGRDVLITDGRNSHFTKTPYLAPEDVSEIRKATFRLDGENQAANFSESYSGYKYEYYFALLTQLNEKERFEIFRDSIGKKGFDLESLNLIKPSRDSSRIRLSYSAKSNRTYKFYGNDLMISVLPFSFSRFSDPSKRKLPVQIDYPINKTDQFEYEIPGGYSVTSKPKDQNIESRYGKYHSEISIKGNKAYVLKNFILFRGTYSGDEYRDFFTFMSNVYDAERTNIIITNK